MIKRIIISALLIALAGCTVHGTTPDNKRANILKMKQEVLSELFKEKPSALEELKNAPGYAVFSNVNIHLIFASAGGGYGVVKNNSTGQHTYMKMGEAGIGLGLGVKDFRAVFVFHNKSTMNHFIEKGWVFGGQADVAAKADEKGDAIGGELVADSITVYQLTETGLAVQATVKGTKYWKDAFLN